MLSEKLKQAREIDQKGIEFISSDERPAFHVTGGIGWINDPNGFSIYKGEYHLFFQYHPYSTHWGPMHWGHVKTKDFVKWEFLPVALAPDTDFDDEGCFSGSAIEMPDGRQLLMYTGVSHEMPEDGIEQVIQQQCIAIGDGINYEKYKGNPVLTANDLPKDGSKFDFRDPKIWRDGDDYYAVVGNRGPDNTGNILLFTSKDGFAWSFVTILDSSHNEYGRMWECPDFFALDGKYMLMTSPQEMAADGLKFHAGFGVICLVGDYDKTNCRFKREDVLAVDYGLDFYAPQTLETEDGRRIMIAWMQNWTNVNTRVDGVRIFGEMTLPRELHYRDGMLIQNPVREIESYRKHETVCKNVVVKEETELDQIKGRIMDMTVTVRPKDVKNYGTFILKIGKDERHETVIKYIPKENLFKIDRSKSALRYDIVHRRKFYVSDHEGEIKLRVIMDKHSIELFINDGEQAASMMLYDNGIADGISFEAESEVYVDVEKYDLVIS